MMTNNYHEKPQTTITASINAELLDACSLLKPFTAQIRQRLKCNKTF
jgi:hypothetical protein